MGAHWLLNLPSWLQEAGLQYTEFDKWQTRSRSSGGYDAVWGIGQHHTASNTTANNDVNYMWRVASGKPIGALYLGRDGHVIIGAAGATNTQGKGPARQMSKGTIPENQGNRYVVAIEAGNDGTGEPWPEAQQIAYIKLSAILTQKLGLQVGDNISHFEAAPGRKYDPAGPSRWENGTGVPVFRTRLWDMDAFRGDVWQHMNGMTPPPIDPPPGEGYNPPTDWSSFPGNKSKPKQSESDYDWAFTKYIQDVIYFKAGGNITRDGKFGPKTKGRVKDCQRVFGFPEAYIDGIVGWNGDWRSPGPYATWPLFDALTGQVDPPVDPPEDGVEAVDSVSWYISQHDTPWSVATVAYGSGYENDKLDHSAFNSYSTPGHPVFVETPGVPGLRATAQGGDGANAVLRRMGLDPYVDGNQATFFTWNGGADRTLYPGDVCYMPD